jgi:hypothetical protein
VITFSSRAISQTTSLVAKKKGYEEIPLVLAMIAALSLALSGCEVTISGNGPNGPVGVTNPSSGPKGRKLPARPGMFRGHAVE